MQDPKKSSVFITVSLFFFHFTVLEFCLRTYSFQWQTLCAAWCFPPHPIYNDRFCNITRGSSSCVQTVPLCDLRKTLSTVGQFLHKNEIQIFFSSSFFCKTTKGIKSIISNVLSLPSQVNGKQMFLL